MALTYQYPPVPADRKRSVERDSRPWLIVLAAMIALADHLSKRFITHHLPPGRAHTVIPHLLRVTHVLNTGAAFSAFADSASPDTVRYALIGFSAIAIVIVGAMLWRSGRAFTLTGLALALILGGAIGNLYDRVHLHYVIDFIEVRLLHYHWPDFNLADSAIVIGACLLILEIFRPQPDGRPQPSEQSQPSEAR